MLKTAAIMQTLIFRPGPRRIETKRALVLVTAVVLFLCQACFRQGPSGELPEAAAGIDLDNYRLTRAPIELGGDIGNASGLTYNRQTGTIFLILNGPTRVLELSRAGERLRTIELEGFDDTEDIVHLDGSRFAVIEERRRTLAIIDIAADTATVSYDPTRRYLVEPEETGNKGLEGLGFDPRAQEFYATREKRPRQIYRFALPADAPEVVSDSPWNAQRRANGLRDLSAVHLDTTTDRMLLLSDESKALIEVDKEGREKSRLRLEKGQGGLLRDIPQAEGVTLTDDRTLYICSEPNLLYIYAPMGG